MDKDCSKVLFLKQTYNHIYNLIKYMKIFKEDNYNECLYDNLKRFSYFKS